MTEPQRFYDDELLAFFESVRDTVGMTGDDCLMVQEEVRRRLGENSDPLVIRSPRGVRAFLNDIGFDMGGNVQAEFENQKPSERSIVAYLTLFDCSRPASIDLCCLGKDELAHSLRKLRRLCEAIEHMEHLFHEANNEPD